VAKITVSRHAFRNSNHHLCDAALACECTSGWYLLETGESPAHDLGFRRHHLGGKATKMSSTVTRGQVSRLLDNRAATHSCGTMPS
jgi:hypothetical protein